MNKQKMLVVDDSLFNRQVLKELFDAEFDVYEACDGVEALDCMRQYAAVLTVVLLDIVMPKKDGLDVLRDMQADVRLKSLPVIITSSASDDVYRMKALELGAVDYISTPFNPPLVKLRVRSTLATREYDRLRLQNEMLSIQNKEDAGYRAVLEDARTAILEFDGQGRILRYDVTIRQELAGDYDRREFMDILLQDGVAEQADLGRLRALFDSVVSHPDMISRHVDMRLLKRSGVHAWYRLRLLKKLDAGTGEPRLLLSISNIDEQKREEEATREQLLRALNQVQSADAAKSAFITQMSHEMRTPLDAIIGFIGLARSDLTDTARLDEYLAKAEFASRHMLSIINDVLDMSAIESGRIAIGYESYNLRELINAVTGIVYPTIHKKNLQFQIMLDGVTEERMMGDRMRISQILLNLLSNAVKFTPQNGSVVMTIRQRHANANRIRMDFEVKDNGIGMSQEFVERLGRPFEQQDASVSRRFSSSGLGLSITKNLIRLMNGAMTVESKEGQGSTFTVSLPVDIVPAVQAEREPYEFAKIQALVIDREEHAAEQTAACFRELGCQCDCATSGKAALALCQYNNYNLVLMDWKLPDLDGRSIIDAIRQAVDNEPHIVIMGYDHAEMNAGAYEDLLFISKPVFPSTALNLLLELYGKYEMKPSKQDAPDFQGRRLLLAEDNPLNREIAGSILTKMGFVLAPTVNGREVVEAFLASDPGEYDAILMDIQMPVLDGYEATRRIRASSHPDAHTIPILAMTASAFSQDVADALACGMNDHIAKPIEIEQLQATLARHICGR